MMIAIYPLNGLLMAEAVVLTYALLRLDLLMLGKHMNPIKNMSLVKVLRTSQYGMSQVRAGLLDMDQMEKNGIRPVMMGPIHHNYQIKCGLLKNLENYQYRLSPMTMIP